MVLKIWARVGETEAADRVAKAVQFLVPGVTLVVGSEVSAAVGRGALESLKALIGAKRIDKSAAVELLKNKLGNATRLKFNKQAAFSGKVALVETYEESPMGAVVLELDWDEDLLNWFTNGELSKLEATEASGSSQSSKNRR